MFWDIPTQSTKTVCSEGYSEQKTRGLFYFAVLYQKHLANIDEALFTTKLVKVPAPQYVVFYNGDDEAEDVSKLRLSDAFIDFDSPGDFEWTNYKYHI